MSAYSWGLEISRRSDAITVGRCNDYDEITMGNPISIYSISYHIPSNATMLLVNW